MSPLPPLMHPSANQAYKKEKKEGKTSLPFVTWLKEKQATGLFRNASGAAEPYFYFQSDHGTPGKDLTQSNPLPEKTEVKFLGLPVNTIAVAAVIVTVVIILTKIVKKSN